MNTHLHELIQQYISGTISDSDAASLEEKLSADAALRDCYLDAIALDSALEMTAQSAEASLRLSMPPFMSAQAPRPESPASRKLQWRPLFAAAAGIVVGICCTSMVFAYVAPSLGNVVMIFEDSFESGPAPLAKGVPFGPGQWSGDYAEVVDEQQSVKPGSGKKMLRLLRGDYEGKSNAKGSHVADLYRLIDVRRYRQEFADGSAVVQLSAGFNAFEFPHGETYTGKMTLHAFDTETATNGSLRTVRVWDDTCLGAAGTGPVRLDRNPSTWQRMTIDLRLPPTTDYLLIHLIIPSRPGTHAQEGFAGHYIDDVRLMLSHSPLR